MNTNTLKNTNLVRCNAVLSRRSVLRFGRNVLRATSGSTSKPSKQKAKSEHGNNMVYSNAIF
jgi:hypothetical protein